MTELTTIPAPAPPARAEIVNDTSGVMRPRNIEEAFRLATAYHASKLLPKRFESPEMIMTAMQFALELGLMPLTGLRQIAVVNGTPSMFGELPLALVYASGKMEYIKEYLIDKGGIEILLKNRNASAPAFGAVCIVKRRGDPEPLESVFTMEDAQQAGLINSTPAWKAHPKRMLKYRARSAALKDKFPDALNGISIAEYDYHVSPDESSAAIMAYQPALPPQEHRPEIMQAIINEPPPKQDDLQVAKVEFGKTLAGFMNNGGQKIDFENLFGKGSNSNAILAQTNADDIWTAVDVLKNWRPSK